jgi:spermidine/putrescine transport system substrate-binding protein
MTDSLTRLQLLRRAAAGGAFLTVPGVLAACGGSSTKSAGTTSGGKQTLAKTLRFSNWTLYIDVNEKTKRHPTLDAFKKKTGTTVQYTEDINDNASYFGKIQGPLSRGQSIDRDIIVMTDNSRYPSLLIKKGWVEKLDKSAIPNIKNLT